VVDGWDHVALVVEGAGGREWINGFISQKTDAMSTGTATSSLLLDAHGRVEQVFGIAAPADGVLLLDVAAERADALQDFLTKMIFWADVTVQRPALARLSVVGTLPGVDSPGPGRSGTDAPAVVPSAVYWTTRTAGTLPVTDLWVPRDGVAAAWDALVAAGAEPTGGMAADALRLRDRRPLLGVDTDARLIPHEVPAFLGTVGAEATRLADVAEGPTSAAVHLNKGCYRGQETVSRVQNLGQPPRRLVLLQLDGSLNQLPRRRRRHHRRGPDGRPDRPHGPGRRLRAGRPRPGQTSGDRGGGGRHRATVGGRRGGCRRGPGRPPRRRQRETRSCRGGPAPREGVTDTVFPDFR
jgi:folate-binding Fe-S cluster repair protein YgfZ